MKRRLIWLGVATPVALGAAGWLAIDLSGYRHHVTNLYGYVFHGGPYVNRAFSTEIEQIAPGTADHALIINDPDMEDRRWGTADFSRGLDEQLTIETSSAAMNSYTRFVSRYQAAFHAGPRRPATGPRQTHAPSSGVDPQVSRLKSFIYRTWLANQTREAADVTRFEQTDEKDRNAEDVIYYFSHYNSACGTVAQVAVALLRDLGYLTRLMRISYTAGRDSANHVFTEYYSPRHAKWVMFDGMENFIPTRDGRPLSAFEYFAAPKEEDSFRSTGKLYPHYRKRAEIWYSKKGPVQTIYRMKSADS